MKSSNDRPATKKDLDALEARMEARMVSKDEFEERISTLVTKDEFEERISTLVTKDEFEERVSTLATKDEFEERVSTLATKVELAKVSHKLDDVVRQVSINTYSIEELKQDVRRLESKLDTRFDMVMEVLDGMTKKLDDLNKDRTASEQTFTRHEDRLDDHEKRIGSLESAVA